VSARCLDAVTMIALPPTQKSILRSLAWRANGAFRVETTYADIRADTGYGYSTVRQETDMLCSLGYLSFVEATRGPGAHVVWDIVVPGRGTIPSSNAETEVPGRGTTPEEPIEVPHAGSIPSPNRTVEVPGHGTTPEKSHQVALLFGATEGSSPPPYQPPPRATKEKDERETETVPWLQDLYRLGWAASNPLDARQTDRLIHDFGMLDIADEIEKFVNYYQRRPQPKTWMTYGRLRTWLGKAKGDHPNGRPQRDSRPVGPSTVAGSYSRLGRQSEPKPE